MIRSIFSFQDSIELNVDIYENGEYELLISTEVEPEPTVQKFTAKDIPQDFWNPEDHDLVMEGENALASAAARKKPNYDQAVQKLNTLGNELTSESVKKF